MRNIGESVLAQLKALSRQNGTDMMSLIRLYAQQRLLYRISVSDSASMFVLKGGVMLAAYNKGAAFRTSDDMDLNGYANCDPAEIGDIIRRAVATPVPDDGTTFMVDELRIVKEHVGRIPGSKILLRAKIHTAIIPLSVDVGFGNVITPDAHPMEIPTLLPNVAPCPVIAGYPLETIVAEKLHAVKQFGLDNTRHKDLFDLWKIQGVHTLDGPLVAEAISRTFQHQGTEIASNMPGLSEEFVKRNLVAWPAFLRKNGLANKVPFADVAAQLRFFADPVLDAANGLVEIGFWVPDEGWDILTPKTTFRIGPG